ncbi:MAG: tryptophan--tRNA ligase [bacterium]|nr:tryptophan--tRNA ligase [bacterium]
MKRVLSGIQPSGELHLGNYLGAIRQWVPLQDQYECFFTLADLHALTSLTEPSDLQRFLHEQVVTYLSCGLDPDKAVIFKQSDVPHHAELMWILATVTPMGLLERAHAYKDKVAKGIGSTVGLFAYPVLQAADILLYSADLVPVGKDQKQHIEIARDIADKFHTRYGQVFTVPEPMIPEEVAVIPGIDGQKMSKSYNNAIPLFASDEQLKKLVMSIITDSAGVADKKEPVGTPLYEIFKLINPEKAEQAAQMLRAGGYGYGDAKKELLSALQDFLSPLRAKRVEVEKKKGYVEEVLQDGARSAKAESGKIMDRVRKLVGL